MPTTCGFPNCKFRSSRYRGQEDNRHFYRIPKRPTILRQAWLNAIGRSEETVVSQLRICSAHFYGGEKHEGDIPVADPQVDPPEFIELPPKESRASERRSRLKAASSASSSSMLLCPAERPQLPSLIRPSRRMHRGLFGSNPYTRFGPMPPLAFGQQRGQAATGTIFGQFGTALKVAESGKCETGVIPAVPPVNFHLTHQNDSNSVDPFAGNFPLFSSIFGGKLPFHPDQLKSTSSNNSSPGQTQLLGQRPLVALLDGRDCSVEMPLLKDIAMVAFCDAQSIGDVHEKVLNEATVALLYNSLNLGRDELLKFKALKLVVRIGSGVHNIDVKAATELGIAICHTPVECVEETADSTLALILSLFRRTFWMAKAIQTGKQPSNMEQLREVMDGATRIRGSTLGLLGLGRVGTAVALRAKAFGFRVLFYDPHLPLVEQKRIEGAIGVIRCASLVEILGQSDCLSIHCPLTNETRHIINTETIKSLKFGVFLVNMGEFELLQPDTILSALKNGQIRSAALDCIPPRGVNQEIYDSICALPNVICTGQSGWYSAESHRELREAAAQEVRRALTGSIPENLNLCVNKAELFALKQLLHLSKYASSNSGPSAQLASTLFPHFPLMHNNVNGSASKNQTEVQNSTSQNNATGNSIGDGATVNSSAAIPLNNYPHCLLMMHPQLWQMANLFQSQQHQPLLNGNGIEDVNSESRLSRNKSSPKRDEENDEENENDVKHEEADEKLPNSSRSMVIEDNKTAEELTEGEETELEEDVPCAIGEE